MKPNDSKTGQSHATSAASVENTAAYRAALAFHIRVAELTPGRGCRLYREQLDRATFRILILLAESEAWSGTARARNMVQSALACCAKASTCVRVLREAGFLDGDTYDRASAELASVKDKLLAHLCASAPTDAAGVDGDDMGAFARADGANPSTRTNASHAAPENVVAGSRLSGLVKTAAAAVNAREHLSAASGLRRTRARPGGRGPFS